MLAASPADRRGVSTPEVLLCSASCRLGNSDIIGSALSSSPGTLLPFGIPGRLVANDVLLRLLPEFKGIGLMSRKQRAASQPSNYVGACLLATEFPTSSVFDPCDAGN